MMVASMHATSGWGAMPFGPDFAMNNDLTASQQMIVSETIKAHLRRCPWSYVIRSHSGRPCCRLPAAARHIHDAAPENAWVTKANGGQG